MDHSPLIASLRRTYDVAGRQGRQAAYAAMLKVTFGFLLATAVLWGAAHLNLMLPRSAQPLFLIGLGVIWLMLFLATSAAALAAEIRRLHDVGLSGWLTAPLPVLMLIFLAFAVTDRPGAAGAAMVALMVVGLALEATLKLKPGDPGENRYGPPVEDRGLFDVDPPQAPTPATERKTLDDQLAAARVELEEAKRRLSP